MDIKQYEKYFIYDEPIPYYSSETLKRREFLAFEISQLLNKKYEEKLSEEESNSLKQLQNEYDNQGLLIYPVTMYSYLDFFIAVNCLMIDKNKTPDPRIIRMSYLDYLFYLVETNNQENQYYSYMLVMLVRIFELCLKLASNDIKYVKDDNGKNNLIIKDEIINGTDFENIKNIILYQNIPNYDDSYVDPKVEEALREAEEFMNKNKKKMASLEDQLVCVLISASLKMKDIYDLTIRKFSKILERVDYKLHYTIYKQAECGGMVTFKQEIDHWMCDLRKGKFDGILMEYDSLDNKINGKTARQDVIGKL